MRLSKWDRLKANISPEPNSGCWLWMGACNSYGYGVMTVKQSQKMAHRLAYEFWRGDIPEGLQIDHLCRVRCCVNPQHLEAVSVQENISRGNVSEHNRRKTHCPAGHAYTEENTHISKKNQRNCRACDRLWHKRRRNDQNRRVPDQVR